MEEKLDRNWRGEKSRVGEIIRILVLWVLGLGILGVGAWMRFALPPVPLVNADSWGFLGPALRWVTDEGFHQIHGRAFFYPWLLTLMIGPDAWLPGIYYWQHVWGLASGVLWFVVWMGWVMSLPGGWVRDWVGPVLGLGLGAIFLWGGQNIMFEQHVRPEAIFPFFALAQLGAMGWWVRTAWRDDQGPGLWLAGALTGFCSLAALALKPSWMLALGVVAVVLVVLLWKVWRDRLSFAVWWKGTVGLLAGVACWWLLQAAVFSQMSWQPDLRSRDFLPRTLVSVHADLILQAWSENKHRGPEISEEDAKFLADLHQAWVGAREGEHNFEQLGFDPDHIFYRTRVFEDLPVAAEEGPEYLMGWYRNALLWAPWSFAGKWWNQTWFAYHPRHTLWYVELIRLRRDYERSLSEIERVDPSRTPLAWAIQQQLQGPSEQLAKTLPERQSITVELPRWLWDLFQQLLIYALVICLLGWLWGVFVRESWSVGLECGLWAMTSLGAVLTVAVTHSFDIDRYGQNLVFLNLLLLGAAPVMLLGAVENWWRTSPVNEPKEEPSAGSAPIAPPQGGQN
jgi:hypothetical protein